MKCGGLSPGEYNLLQKRSKCEWYCTKCLSTVLSYAETHDLIEEPTVHYQPSFCTDTAFVDPNWDKPDLVEQRKSYKHDLLIIHLSINSIQNKFDELAEITK